VALGVPTADPADGKGSLSGRETGAGAGLGSETRAGAETDGAGAGLGRETGRETGAGAGTDGAGAGLGRETGAGTDREAGVGLGATLGVGWSSGSDQLSSFSLSLSRRLTSGGLRLEGGGREGSGGFRDEGGGRDGSGGFTFFSRASSVGGESAGGLAAVELGGSTGAEEGGFEGPGVAVPSGMGATTGALPKVLEGGESDQSSSSLSLSFCAMAVDRGLGGAVEASGAALLVGAEEGARGALDNGEDSEID
jgi:hypothetical protein